MELRGWIMSAVLFTGCGGSGLPQGNHQIEVLEGDVAALVELGTERITFVERSKLPSYAREGDVLVDGRPAPGLTEQLRAQVEALRASFPPAEPGGFEL